MPGIVSVPVSGLDEQVLQVRRRSKFTGQDLQEPQNHPRRGVVIV
jgi:hypothetical protein